MKMYKKILFFFSPLHHFLQSAVMLSLSSFWNGNIYAVMDLKNEFMQISVPKFRVVFLSTICYAVLPQ